MQALEQSTKGPGGSASTRVLVCVLGLAIIATLVVLLISGSNFKPRALARPVSGLGQNAHEATPLTPHPGTNSSAPPISATTRCVHFRIIGAHSEPIEGAVCRLESLADPNYRPISAFTGADGEARIPLPVQAAWPLRAFGEKVDFFEGAQSVLWKGIEAEYIVTMTLREQTPLHVFAANGTELTRFRVINDSDGSSLSCRGSASLYHARATVRAEGYLDLPLQRIEGFLANDLLMPGGNGTVYVIPSTGAPGVRIKVEADVSGTAWVKLAFPDGAPDTTILLGHLSAACDRLPAAWLQFYEKYASRKNPYGVVGEWIAGSTSRLWEEMEFNAQAGLVVYCAKKVAISVWMEDRCRSDAIVTPPEASLVTWSLAPAPDPWWEKSILIERDRADAQEESLDGALTFPCTIRLKGLRFGENRIKLPPRENRYEVRVGGVHLASAYQQFSGAEFATPVVLRPSSAEVRIRVVSALDGRPVAVRSVDVSINSVRGEWSEQESCYVARGVPVSADSVTVVRRRDSETLTSPLPKSRVAGDMIEIRISP